VLIKSIKPAGAAVASVGNPDAHVSFAQYGEDLILLPTLRKYGRLEGGFYVDVGAFHPFRFSNTALLHLHKGWRGVNIDASPDAIALFNEHRPGDINILAAVSDEETDLEYVTFNKGNINSLDARMIKRWAGPDSPFTVKERVRMRTQRLDTILGSLASPPDRIDLLSVDCEGLDYRVLNSNDWERFHPFAVLVECHGLRLDMVSGHPVHRLLARHGYRLVSHAFVTSLYIAP